MMMGTCCGYVFCSLSHVSVCVAPVQVLVHELQRLRPMSHRMQRMMERVFLGDKQSTFFMSQHIAHGPPQRETSGASGQYVTIDATPTPHAYMLVVNHFGALGGFRLLAARFADVSAVLCLNRLTRS